MKVTRKIFLIFINVIWPTVAFAEYPDSPSITEWMSAISSLVGVIVAALALLFLKKTFNETREATRIMANQLRQTEAILTAKPPSIIHKSQKFGFEIQQIWINTGLSPALRCSSTIKICSSESKLELFPLKGIFDELNESVKVTVGQGQTIYNNEYLSKISFQKLSHNDEGPDMIVVYSACLFTTLSGESHFVESTFEISVNDFWRDDPSRDFGLYCRNISKRNGEVDLSFLNSLSD